MPYVNAPTINPKNSHKDTKAVNKITFTMLQKYMKIILIKYAVKHKTLQHGKKQGLVNHIDKYYPNQPPLTKALRRKI